MVYGREEQSSTSDLVDACENRWVLAGYVDKSSPIVAMREKFDSGVAGKLEVC